MTEKYNVKISIKAKEDLKKLILYIKNDLKEPQIASKYYKIIKGEIENLANFPKKFACIDDENIKDLKIRKLVINNYIVFYRINEEKRLVTVERILYNASNWIEEL